MIKCVADKFGMLVTSQVQNLELVTIIKDQSLTSSKKMMAEIGDQHNLCIMKEIGDEFCMLDDTYLFLGGRPFKSLHPVLYVCYFLAKRFIWTFSINAG